MKIGLLARFLSVSAAVFLGVTGTMEWRAMSSGAPSSQDETSSAALSLRAQGKLKIGLALGLLALASLGKGNDELTHFHSGERLSGGDDQSQI